VPPTRRTPGGGNCSDVAGARPRRTVETSWTSGEVCSRCPPWQGRLRALPRGRAGLGAEGLGPGDRSRRCRFRYPHPVVLTTIPRHRGRTRGRGADLCLGRDRGHVQRKRTWPPPICRHGLLLEPGGGVPNHGCPLHTPLAREHASLCPGYPELRRRSGWPNSATAPLARLAPRACDRHGHFVHPATDRVLRG